MKKKILHTLAIPVVMAAVLALLQFAAHSDITGTVVRVKGAPELTRDGKTMGIKNGTAVREGDEIITGKGQSLNIRLNTDDLLVVAPLTKLRITKNAAAGGKVLIEQDKGFVWARVKKVSTEERFQIRTPTAVAGVRGTAFSSMVESEGEAWFCVCEGMVNIQYSGKAADVNAGKAFMVSDSGKNGIPMDDHRMLEKKTSSSENCFQCHQGGHKRDAFY